MPTDNPKISSYVPQQIYDRFKEYQKENELTMSQTVVVILAEYFGIEETLKETQSSSPIGGVTLSTFQELQERLEKVEIEVERLKSTKNVVEVKEELEEQKEDSSQLNLLSELSNKKLELMGKDLAKRLEVSSGRLSTHKKDMTLDKFQEWSSKKDPDSIVWSYKKKVQGRGFVYFPLTEDSGIISKLQEWITNNIK